MWKYRIYAIVILLFLINLSFLNIIDSSSNSSKDIVTQNIEEPALQIPAEDQSETINNIGSRTSKENDELGGSWVDGFEDNSGIESLSKLKIEKNKIRLANCSFSKISDTFEGVDGTDMDVYDPNYTVYSTTSSSSYDAEIDTTQKYEGSSSARLYLNDWAENVWFNRTVQYTEPIIEMNYYFRIYTGPTSASNYIGCSFTINLFSGATLITYFNVYRQNIYYNNGGTFTDSNIRLYHSTWYRVRAVFYKVNGLYSNYDLSVWDVSNFQTPKFSCQGVSLGLSGISTIDNVRVYMRSVWDTTCTTWVDGLSIVQTGFNSPGYLQSKPISLPNDMFWDSVYINKTEPNGSSIELNILNAANDQKIYGPITTSGEINIRDIVDSNLFPSIKLRAFFDSHGQTSPVLNSWGVSWNATNTWRDTLFGGLKSSTINLTSDAGNCTSIFTFTDWDKYTSNPVLSDGPSSSFDDEGVLYPAVIYDGFGYKMYYTGAVGNVWKIGLATSSNGITWSKYSSNPVLTPGPGGAWDDNAVGRPSVIFDGTTYKMWYQGGRGTGVPMIGYATSVDGIIWQKHSSNPVLDITGTGSWEMNGVYAPNVMFDGVKYTMWFSGQDSSSTHRIGLATSYDGINWTKYANNPVLTGLTGNSQGVMNLFVLQKDNMYLGWHSYDYGSYSEVYHAYSNDGISWNKVNSPVVPRSSSSAWDDSATFAPEVMLKDNKYYLYYAGRTSTTTRRIGFALSKYESTGTLLSEPINLPAKHYFKNLIINKTEFFGSFINVSILDGITQEPIDGFENINSLSRNIFHLSPIDHPSIILKATFTSNGENTPILHDWSINWTKNEPLKILQVSSNSSTVYRTQSVGIWIKVIEYNIEYVYPFWENLSMEIEYKAPSDIDWQSGYISDISYSGYPYGDDHGAFDCIFTPTIGAELGYYTFKFTLYDLFQDTNVTIIPDLVEVLNNKPTPPDVLILPVEPIIAEDLNVIAWNSTDIETPANQIKYWYRWYKNGSYKAEFDNETSILYTHTTKTESWSCMVYPFDGDDLGKPAEAIVIIGNTPPTLNETFNYLQMIEDFSITLEDKLTTIFRDIDGDMLTFSSSGQNKITINIIQQNGTIELIPMENWFGTEYITFYANDSSTFGAKTTVEIEVIPANDLPEIISVGNQITTVNHLKLDFIMTEDEWLNLTITVSDIDGDVERGLIAYSINLTQTDELYLDQNTLVFHPGNADVGWYFININVTDNNETPIEYLSQRIGIHVLNANDPPSVQIIEPKDGDEFFEKDEFTLLCLSTDPDFSVNEYLETLTYRWYTNHSELGDLGTGAIITNISLPPGNYTLFVEVEDKDKAKAIDSIKINIKENPKVKDLPSEETTISYYWFIFIIIILLVAIILAMFLNNKRQKRKQLLRDSGIPQQEVLQPVAAYQPDRQLPAVIPAAPTLITQQAPQVSAGTTTTQATPLVSAGQVTPEPAGQLPPSQPVIQPITTPEEQKVGLGSELTPQQKLALLEERLLRGEIDQDIYLNLKAKYEMEAKPYEPAPQLPPAQITPTPVQEQVVPLQEVVPPETMQTPMEQPMITETPIEPVQQQPTEVPPDLPPDAYQQPPVQPTIPQPTPPQTPTPIQPPQPKIQQQPQPQLQQVQQPQDSTSSSTPITQAPYQTPGTVPETQQKPEKKPEQDDQQ